jgi:hypothetical protein
MTQPTTGEIAEVRTGVFFTLLPPCACRTLPRVLRPEPSSFVWLVRHMPHSVVEWIDLPAPLFRGDPPRPLRVRGAAYDAQVPLPTFLELVPRSPGSEGVLLFGWAPSQVLVALARAVIGLWLALAGPARARRAVERHAAADPGAGDRRLGPHR